MQILNITPAKHFHRATGVVLDILIFNVCCFFLATLDIWNKDEGHGLTWLHKHTDSCCYERTASMSVIQQAWCHKPGNYHTWMECSHTKKYYPHLCFFLHVLRSSSVRKSCDIIKCEEAMTVMGMSERNLAHEITRINHIQCLSLLLYYHC